MKRKISELSEQQRMETLDALYTAAGVLKGRQETKDFLKNLLTVSERVMLGRRILIARSLLSGEQYTDIMENMKVGSDTIARVEKWMMERSSGYENAITKMREEMRNRERKVQLAKLYSDHSAAGGFARLKKKYPLHFLFFPLPKKYKDLYK